MKNYVKCLMLGMLLSSLSFSFAQGITTQGKNFWVSFLVNSSATVPGYYPSLSLFISAEQACTGTISNPNTGWNMEFSITDNEVKEINIPEEDILQGYVIEYGKVTQQGLLVTSNKAISLYASNYRKASFDVTFVLPINALGDEYIVQTYATRYSVTFPIGEALFLIVATENNTIIDITPSVETLDDPLYSDNPMYSISLNAGETYLAGTIAISNDGLCIDNGGFSGSRIKARDNKKIAVFNGNRCADIPVCYGSCDHLVEQALPVSSWGKKFAITSSLKQKYNRVKVTVAKNNTQIHIDGILVSTINERETYEFEMTQEQGYCFLQTSEPSTVYLYLVGGSYDGIDNPPLIGGSNDTDPSMILIPPIEQQIKRTTFKVFTEGIHFVNIVANSTDVANVMLNERNISSEFTTLSGNADFSFARVRVVGLGDYTLYSESGLMAYTYGFGLFESYGYMLTSSSNDPDYKCLSINLSSNPITSTSHTLSFTLPEASQIKVSLYDKNGNRINTIPDIFDDHLEAGLHDLSLDKLFNYRLDPLTPYILVIETKEQKSLIYLYVSKI